MGYILCPLRDRTISFDPLRRPDSLLVDLFYDSLIDPLEERLAAIDAASEPILSDADPTEDQAEEEGTQDTEEDDEASPTASPEESPAG